MRRRSPESARPLLLTNDPGLLDDLLRLAAATGVEVDVAAEAGAAGRCWSGAPLVLVGDDQSHALAAAGLSRRPRVFLVGSDLDDADVWRRGLAVGAEQVVFLPDAEEWLISVLADTAEGLGRSATVVGVVGGRGGAGATTLAVALAVTGTRQRLSTLLIDGDPLGGGIDLVVGGETTGGLRWPDLAGSRGRLSGTALTAALPRVDELTVLSWDRSDAPDIPAEAMEVLLAAAVRGSDLAVVDLPRRAGAAARAAQARADVVLLVVPAEVRACASAARVAATLAPHCPDVRVVVRGPAPSKLPADLVADSLGLPLAGSVKAEPGLAVALERGEPPARSGRGPLATFCNAFLRELISRHGRGVAA